MKCGGKGPGFGSVVATAFHFQYDPDRKGPLAQLAEQQTLNLRVEGSIPSRLTNPPIPNPSLSFGGLTAKVAELVYALDLGSSPEKSGWGFESPLSHSRRGIRRTAVSGALPGVQDR